MYHRCLYSTMCRSFVRCSAFMKDSDQIMPVSHGNLQHSTRITCVYKEY